MTTRGWCIGIFGCLIWVLLVILSTENTYNDFLAIIDDLRSRNEGGFIVASAAWCGASLVLGRIFSGK